MQIRLRTSLNDQEYVVTQAWHHVQLEACPLHPKGGCSFARHGSYGRKTPYAAFSPIPDLRSPWPDARWACLN